MTDPEASDATDSPELIESPPPGLHRPSAAPAAHAPEFIALPPGLPLPTSVADSATHRLAQLRKHSNAPALPTAPTRILPVMRAAPAPILFTPAPTAWARLPSTDAAPVLTTWMLRLGDATEYLPVGSAACVGRNPTTVPGRPEASLLTVIDPAKTVSKTHAMFWATGDDLRVQDLESTNGVRVIDADEIETILDPRESVVVSSGATVYLGEFPVAVTEIGPRGAEK